MAEHTEETFTQLYLYLVLSGVALQHFHHTFQWVKLSQELTGFLVIYLLPSRLWKGPGFHPCHACLAWVSLGFAQALLGGLTQPLQL